MPLDTDEVAHLLPEIEAIVADFRAALRRDPDGKVRIDRQERKRIGKAIAAFGVHLGRDILDGPGGNEIPGVVHR
jgi:hypothetical protein